MGLIEDFAEFFTLRAAEFEKAIKDAKAKAQAGTYTFDLLFKDSLKLWVNGLDGWCKLLPYSKDTLPILFGVVGPNTGYSGAVAVGFVGNNPPGTILPNIGLIPLNGGGAGGAVVTTTLQADGTLSFDIPGLNGNTGEHYQCVAFYVDTGKVYGAAVLLLTIT